MGGKVYTIPEIAENGAYVGADIEVEPSWVECQICHAQGPVFDESDEDPENAVAAWNRRFDAGVDGKDMVRCKGCRHLRAAGKGVRYCNVWAKIDGLGPDGFCQYGERRKTST